ncbi:uncharacterized protein LOC104882365 [Vitis vinifera]|uniref:uncharacterized protein LOC104882365 n=1 Tax=Vitis vinifera TaxID=29760 RepID=UPI00053F89FC|nr:uncharacterized protein LOC104882365 [Vitis vinifera]|eukprot:XP_010663742.1 PREDICTED: uncharacterized protein LOC104882365 [Vitis vinifera]
MCTDVCMVISYLLCLAGDFFYFFFLFFFGYDQVVLELQDDGNLTTSDDPPVVFGSLDGDFIQKSGLCSGNLLRFAVSDGGLSFVDGKLERADLHYLGKVNRARAFADSYSKVMFQHSVRHSPLSIDDLLASITSTNDQEKEACDVEMAG